LTARKLAVGVGATWQFAGTPPSLAASTHVRDSGEALNDHKSLDAEEICSTRSTGSMVSPRLMRHANANAVIAKIKLAM
jgi:hypothetical protein